MQSLAKAVATGFLAALQITAIFLLLYVFARTPMGGSLLLAGATVLWFRKLFTILFGLLSVVFFLDARRRKSTTP